MSFSKFYQFLGINFLVLIIGCQSNSDSESIDYEQQIDSLFADYDDIGKPGVALAVVKDGSVIFQKGYGSANLEYDIPITPNTIFHVASVSKQFTAFSILLLESEGKLSLDDRIQQYLPEVPDFGKTIKLRHLLHHTSGLRDQWNLLLIAGWRFDDVITTEHILKLVAKQKELNFEPGEEYLYCNTGYTLLAEVVARVSGKSFAQFTREEIFDPLGMTNTLFYDDHEKVVKNRAYSYKPDSIGYKKSVLNYETVGATSLFTTAEDLTLWATNFENPIVGNKKLIEEMDSRGVLNNGDTISYALGQVVNKHKGLKRISHGGVDAGYRAYLGRFPDQMLSIIALSNDGSFQWQATPMKVADIFLKHYVSEEEPIDEPEEADNDNALISIHPDSLKSFEGSYELNPGFIFTITLEDGTLYSQATNQEKTELQPISMNKFRYVGIEAEVVFPKDSLGQVTHLIHYQHGTSFNAKKIEPFDVSSINLSEYSGKYYSDELTTEYRFEIMDSQLVAIHQRHSNILLTPTKSDVLSGNVWFFEQIQMIRNDYNDIVGFELTNGRVRKLKFEKVECDS